MVRQTDTVSRGYVKLLRGEITDYLLRDRNALHLLTAIALRARWCEDVSPDGLRFGQALVGDYAAIGLTRKEYRCAAGRLAKLGLVSFAGTRRGTVATLLDSRVFMLRDERNVTKQGQPEGQPEGHQLSEVKTEIGAINGATVTARKGPEKGQIGATKNALKQGKNETRTTPARPGTGEWDALFNSFCLAVGVDPAELTQTAADDAAMWLAQILSVCPWATPEEIARRGRNYGKRMSPTCRISFRALSTNWAALGGRATSPAAASTAPDNPPLGWRERLEEDCPGNRVNADRKPWAEVPAEVRARLWPSIYPNGRAVQHVA